MYELVNDVESYPQFLPWCNRVDVLRRQDDLLQATLHLAQGGLKYSFTTENRMIPGSAITLALVEGPFNKFEGLWRFNAAPEGSEVSPMIEFEFANRVLNFSFGKVFGHIANSMVAAFCERAREHYGG